MAGLMGRGRAGRGRRAAAHSRISGKLREAQARPWLSANLSSSSRLATPSLS
jgi:hypothetical protein